MGLLPAASRGKRLLWAVMGGYGLFLHAALVHRQHLWAETTTSTTTDTSSSSGGGGGGALTSLVSRALLRREQAEQQAQGQQPQYEAQAFGLQGAAAKEKGAAASTEPPITSPLSEFWRAEEARIRAEPEYAAAVDPGSARPLRTPGEMRRAQECFRRGEGYAYLMHMRKAGGTTLRQYMNNFIMETEASRGRRPRVYVTEGTTFNISCFRDQGELVVVTALRHPIARILSAYWYEGRTWTKVPPLHPSTDGKIKAALYDPEEMQAQLPLSFKEWVRRTRVDDYNRWHTMSKRSVWSSVDNYFIRTLTQRYRPNPVAAITEREFRLAKRILGGFDLVLITEQLKWANQTAYARGVLTGEGLGGGVAVERRGMEEVVKGERGGKMQHHNQYRDKGDDADIDAETLQGLWRSNYWDILLYDYARNLVAQRMSAFEQEGVGKGDGRPCKPPVNDPNYRRDAPSGQDPDKPNRDSYLYTAPFCETNDYNIQELDETLDFEW